MARPVRARDTNVDPRRTAGARRSRTRLTDAAIVLALAVAIVATYAPVVGYEFINYDDPSYVTENPHVTGGLSSESVRWALTGVHASNWFPVTWLSHMADYELFGAAAGGHHATNVVLHAAAAALLFLAFRTMTGALWPSALLAALFALHPLRVESVAWVAERKDVLAAFFWTLGLWCYARWARRPSPGRHVAVLLAFGLGLLSKGTVVTFPLACLVLDWWPLGRVAAAGAPTAAVPGGAPRASVQRLVLGKAGLIGLAVLGTALTVEIGRRYAAPLREDLPIAVRLPSAVLSYALYLWKTVWPADLAVFYPLHGAPLAAVVVAAAVLAAVTIVAVRQAQRRPYLIVGWLWYLVTLLPMIDLVRWGGRDLADRYTYIPSIGLFLMVAWGARDLAGEGRARRRVVAAVAAAAVVASVIVTRAQLRHWRDSITLYEHALAVTTNNHLAHYNVGVALADAGRVDDALAHYTEAVRIEPDYALAHGNLGKLLAMRGDLRGAIEQYEAALGARPDFAEAHNNLAIALEASGRPHDALAHYAEAVRLSPGRADGYMNLAAALSAEGRTDEAITALETALRVRPDFLEARVALADAYASAGRRADARRAAEDAVALAGTLGRHDLAAELARRLGVEDP